MYNQTKNFCSVEGFIYNELGKIIFKGKGKPILSEYMYI